MMPANQAMLDLLVALVAGSSTPLASGLAELLREELVEENGCWFLASLREGARTASLASFVDRSGLECFVNHIHIEDFLETSDANRMSQARVALGRRAQREARSAR